MFKFRGLSRFSYIPLLRYSLHVNYYYSTNQNNNNNNNKDESVKSLSRKFYKLVHPDRFSMYPKQKKQNEHSLKQLINLINALSGESKKNNKETDKHIYSMNESYKLIFYIFPKNINKIKKEETIEFLTISCNFNENNQNNTSIINLYDHLQNELKKTLISLFKQANLPCNIKLDKIERESFWEQSSSDVNLLQFLTRYSSLAQERAKIRDKIEKEITMYRTAFHFKNNLQIQTDLSSIIYKQENMIEIPLYGDSTASIDYVDEIITPYSASNDIYGNEYSKLHLKSLKKLSSIIDKSVDSLYNCTIVFSDKTENSIPYFVDSQGRIHLHYEKEENEWLNILNSIEYNQVHALQRRNKERISAENLLSLKLGLKYISAASFDISNTPEYQEFLQRLIEASNKGKLTENDFKNGLYKKYTLIIVPINDNKYKDKYYTGDSNGLIIPNDCSIERLKQFISKHSLAMENKIKLNAELDDKEVQFIHQLKRRLRVSSIRRDRYVSRKQMYHCCINLRSLRKESLVEGLTFVSANNLLRVMDDGTLIIPWNFSPTYTF